jgi:hypothetical protein
MVGGTRLLVARSAWIVVSSILLAGPELAAAGEHAPDRSAEAQMPIRRRLMQRVEPPSAAVLAASTGGRAARARLASANLANVLVNDPAGELPYMGNTQMEPSIAASGDTLVCGFSDSGGLYGNGTVSGFAVSFDGGAAWLDAGSLPNQGLGGSEMVFGDPTMATDGRGHWFCLSLYDLGNGTQGPGSGDIGLVLHTGRFDGATLQWSLPRVVVGGVYSLVDVPHLVVDPDRDRLYVTFTNFSPPTTGWGQVEVLTLGDGGATQLHRVVVQPEVIDTNNAGSRLALGPNGEVYCAWESGILAGGDGQGPAYQMVARSLDQGASFGAPAVAATVIESWLSAPPGFNREEESVEFPSIAVDRSNGPNRGRVYLAWHDAVEIDFSGSLLPVAESVAPNDLPPSAQVLPGTSNFWQIDGTLPSGDPADWYRFTGHAGEHVRLILRPNAYVQIGVRLRWRDATGWADTLMAASAKYAGDWVYFLFSLPVDNDYYVQIERQLYSGSYTAWLRKSTTTLPCMGIDHRDIAVVSSPDGVTGWTQKVRVNDDTGYTDQAFPEIVVDGDGGAHVVWYDRRYDARTRVLADYVMASSFDGGLTFTPNVRVTEESSWWQVPADAKPNFGDRCLPLAAGEMVYAGWADGRLGQPDVRVAPVRVGFDVACPESLRAVVGQGLGLEIEVSNSTPYGDAGFEIQVDSDVPQLPDETFAVGPLAAGQATSVVYDPQIGSWIHQVQPLVLRVTVTSDRSAKVWQGSVRVINDQVPVVLADFTAVRAPSGVRLAWRAAGGTEFHVERAPDDAAGPWSRLTVGPVRPGKGGGCEFLDENAAAARLAYRLVAVTAGEEAGILGPWIVEAVPGRVALRGAVPNPFNPTTAIHFELPRTAPVELRLLDVRGRVVRALLAGGLRGPGAHEVLWDGRDASGVALPSGVYLVELRTLGARRTSRLVLLR